MTYLGVYSNTVASTRVGTKLTLEKKKDSKLAKVSFGKEEKDYALQDRHTFTGESIADAKLNVAKIRVVSTIPGKDVAKELRGKAYVGFILTEVQESHSEKVELVPLPGDTYASYFYGASPRQFNFSGVLLNTDQDQWRDSFEQLYERYLRGSASSRNFNIVQVRYGDRIVSGWLTNMSQQQSSQSDLYSQLSFSVLISRVDMLNPKKDKYTEYLVEQSDSFDAADLSDDYALLNSSTYNALINPLRTGTVVPPQRPHRGGRRRGNNNCYFTEVTGDGGESNQNGGVTISDHINDAANCTVMDAIQNQKKKIDDLAKKIRKKVASKKFTKEQLKGFQDQLHELEKQLEDKLNNDVVKETRRLEVEASLLRGYNAKHGTSIKNFSDIPVELGEGMAWDGTFQPGVPLENSRYFSGEEGAAIRQKVGGKEVVVARVHTVVTKNADGTYDRQAVVEDTWRNVSKGRRNNIQGNNNAELSAEERQHEGAVASAEINKGFIELDRQEAARIAEQKRQAKQAAKDKEDNVEVEINI